MKRFLLTSGFALLAWNIFVFLRNPFDLMPAADHVSPLVGLTAAFAAMTVMVIWQSGLMGIMSLLTLEEERPGQRFQMTLASLGVGGTIALIGVMLQHSLDGGDRFTLWFFSAWAIAASISLILTNWRSQSGDDGLQITGKLPKRLWTRATFKRNDPMFAIFA